MIHLCIFVPHFNIKQSRIIYREELTELYIWNWNNDLKIHWCTLIIEFLESRIFWILKTFVTNVNVKWHQLNIFYLLYYSLFVSMWFCISAFVVSLSMLGKSYWLAISNVQLSSCFKFFTPNFRWEFYKLYILTD